MRLIFLQAAHTRPVAIVPFASKVMPAGITWTWGSLAGAMLYVCLGLCFLKAYRLPASYEKWWQKDMLKDDRKNAADTGHQKN